MWLFYGKHSKHVPHLLNKSPISKQIARKIAFQHEITPGNTFSFNFLGEKPQQCQKKQEKTQLHYK